MGISLPKSWGTRVTLFGFAEIQAEGANSPFIRKYSYLEYSELRFWGGDRRNRWETAHAALASN
jgi:hypothetical protein